MPWSPQQEQALKQVSAWLKDPNAPQIFRLFGWAGTGKSTLATHLAKDVKKVCFAAFTGKAALVMQRRGCKGASTIHSLIYTLDGASSEPRFTVNPESAAATANLIVIDEVSMVDETLALDLLSFNTKVLVLGDPFQLPPVRGAGYFINADPDVMLTEIHRQAADNPIIRMSIDVREDRKLDFGSYGTSAIIRRSDVSQADVLAADTVLVGRNQTRRNYNARIRQLRKLPAHSPVAGDKVICLRNNREKRLLNGQVMAVSSVKEPKPDVFQMALKPEDDKRAPETTVQTHRDIFFDEAQDMEWSLRKEFDEFTFGYALTCHKSQGSQWPNVYLFDESKAFRQDRGRWLYTAITRAAERITIVR